MVVCGMYLDLHAYKTTDAPGVRRKERTSSGLVNAMNAGLSRAGRGVPFSLSPRLCFASLPLNALFR